MPFSTQRPEALRSSSGLRGLMSHRAGPPILYHVCGASATFGVTIASRPENGLASCMGSRASQALGADQFSSDFPNVAGPHGHDEVASLGMRAQILDDPGEVGQVHGNSPLASHFLDQVMGIDARPLILAVADKIDVGHDGL